MWVLSSVTLPLARLMTPQAIDDETGEVGFVARGEPLGEIAPRVSSCREVRQSQIPIPASRHPRSLCLEREDFGSGVRTDVSPGRTRPRFRADASNPMS